MALGAQMMPPAVVVILIIFSRNHNTIASKLLAINEKGAYSYPPSTDPVKLRKQDDDIFNKARNINGAVKRCFHEAASDVETLARSRLVCQHRLGRLRCHHSQHSARRKRVGTVRPKLSLAPALADIPYSGTSAQKSGTRTAPG